ncbi:MAG: methyltransferase, partial [Polyangiaceae bacterium]
MFDSPEAIRDFIARGWIGVPGTKLRREDEKKAKELVGFLREVAFLLAQPRARTGAIVDAAAGKGYVGVAIAMHAGRRVSFMERDPKRAAAIEAAADALSVPRDRIDALAVDVGDRAAWPDAPALVVSLHACGDATDRVIAESVAARARAILVAPCCVAGDLPAARRAAARAEATGLDRHAEV